MRSSSKRLRPPLRVMRGTKISEEESSLLEQAAAANGVTVSAYIRGALLRAVNQDLEKLTACTDRAVAV